MPNNYILLETIALTQETTSVTFDNLPTSGYTDLKVVISGRSTRSNPTDTLFMKINNNSGVTNSHRRIYAFATTVGSDNFTTTTNGMEIGGITANTATANTYGNQEIYIPNYRSSSQKSVSYDGVSENNSSSGNFLVLEAALWQDTGAITSLVFRCDVGNFMAGSTFSLYGIAALGTTPVLAPKATGGNIVANDGTYWYHAFTSSGYFVPQTNLTADLLVIAGGGGGGGDIGGGAGAGRVYNLTSQALANATNYACTVGAGGATNTPAVNAPGLKGTDSSFVGGVLSHTSLGGGGGNGRQAQTTAPNDGWNGGGGSYDSSRGPTAGNGGYAGGTTLNPGTTTCYAGGGGGAAEAGNTDAAGEGGDGINTFSSWATATSTGVSGFYAGGGGGGYYSNGTTILAGGAGGGGNGGNNVAVATPGIANTGSGGGGGGSSGSVPGATGGSGIVIIRYPIAS